MTASEEWWLHAAELVPEISRRSSGSMRSAQYQFGDLCLEVSSGYDRLLDELQLWYSECRLNVPQPSDNISSRWCVRTINDPPMALVSFSQSEPVDRAVIDLSVFDQLHRTRHVVVQSPVPSWRLIYSSSEAARPFMTSCGFNSLVDLAEAPPKFLFDYIVSAMMSLQRRIIFVHAASVGVYGKGALLWGFSGGGKTTTSLALASRGHAFFGDNTACIRTQSGELLPFRRAAAVKPGCRAQAVEEHLGDSNETVALPDGRRAILMNVGNSFPASQAGPMKLSSVFYLRRFADKPAFEAFVPSVTDRIFVSRMTLDPMAVFGVSPARRLMNIFILLEMISKVKCYFLDVGMPEDTASLIEKTMEEQ